MSADIYRTARSDTFLLVPQGMTLINVPGEILQRLGAAVYLKTRELCDPLLCIDAGAITADLVNRGYAIHRC